MSVLNEKDNNICGERVKEAIKAKGIKQARLAEMLHITENAVSMIINGKRSLSPKRAAQISEITGWRADYLLGLSDYKKNIDEIIFRFNKITDAMKALQYLVNYTAENYGVSITPMLDETDSDHQFISVRRIDDQKELLYIEDTLSSEILHFIGYQVNRIVKQALEQEQRNNGAVR